MAIRTGYFFNVDSLLFSPFSEPVMLWSLVTITQPSGDSSTGAPQVQPES